MNRPTGGRGMKGERLAKQTGITTASDEALLAAYMHREDASAYSELVRRHQIPVYRLLTGLLADPDAAEPATEDVFVRAARRLDQLDDASRLELWLGELARELATEREAAEPVVVAAPTATDETMLAQQGRQAVRGAVRMILAALPAEERSVLVLAELHGEPIERIATALGISEERVQTRLASARARFIAGLTAQRQPTETLLTSTSGTRPTKPNLAPIRGYEFGPLLGEGGMGRVYGARINGQNVAVKVLMPEYTRMTRARFTREVIALKAVRHANIVEFIAAGETDDGGLYLTMERLYGVALLDEVGEPIAAKRALHILRHILVGLKELHTVGIVHRDIKPENVLLVDRDGDRNFAKIIDLGIAKLPSSLLDSETRVRLTSAGAALGTPAYISPEQAMGVEVDGRADLYSATVILFEMLTGRLPFVSHDAGTLLAMHISAMPPRLRVVAPQLPEQGGLESIVYRGLSKRRERRFDSAQSYIDAVDETIRQLPS